MSEIFSLVPVNQCGHLIKLNTEIGHRLEMKIILAYIKTIEC